jgi:membrane-bound ClpP family serine protease
MDAVKRIPVRVFGRYLLLMIPGDLLLVLVLMVAQQWFPVSRWLFWALIACAILKDVIMFPFVWRAYDWERPSPYHSVIGERGLVKSRLDPAGTIQVRGELWKAECRDADQAIESGQFVQVLEMNGLTLVVEPWSSRLSCES